MESSRCLFCNNVIEQHKQGRPRKFCNAKCGRRYRRTSACTECGNPVWDKRKLCVSCSNAHMTFAKRQNQAILWNQILDLRKEGLLNYEIAARLKRSHTMIATTVNRMKRAGVKVPVSTYDPATWMHSWYRLRETRGDIQSPGSIA
jgi:hypothetical protein